MTQVLLAHFDGANGATSFTDETARHTLTALGAAALSTSQAKFGASSLFVANPGDRVLVESNVNDFVFGTGDFTIDFWVYLIADQTSAFFDTRPSTTSIAIFMRRTIGNPLSLRVNSVNVIFGTTVPTTGVMHHVALTRASGQTRLFLDGTQEGSTYADTNDYVCNSSGPSIGGTFDDLNGNNEYIDEVRVLKGTAAWTANFTPPTSPYVVADQQAGVTFAGAGVLSADTRSVQQIAARLAATGSLQATGTGRTPWQAAATFAGAGALSVNTRSAQRAQARIAAFGALSPFAEPTESEGEHWPDELPQCPILNSWEETPQSGVYSFKPEVGPQKVRRRMSEKFWISSASFHMTNAQLITFKQFYETTLEDGTIEFNWPHPITKVAYHWNFIPGDEPKIVRATPNSSAVQIRLVRR